jgi:hypothetical protein
MTIRSSVVPCRSLMSRYKTFRKNTVHKIYGYQHIESLEFISALHTVSLHSCDMLIHIHQLQQGVITQKTALRMLPLYLKDSRKFLSDSQFDILPSSFLKVKRFKDIQSYSFTCQIQVWNLVPARNKEQKLRVFRNRVLIWRVNGKERLHIIFQLNQSTWCNNFSSLLLVVQI